jgi:alanyl-tRNA synthetase
VRRALANAAPTGARAVGKRIADIAFDRHVVYGAHGREFKSFADDLKPQVGSGVVAVVSRSGGKAATIAVGVTPDLMDRFDKLNQWAPTPSAVEAPAAPTWRRWGPEPARVDAALRPQSRQTPQGMRRDRFD